MSAVTIVAHKPPGRKSLANFYRLPLLLYGYYCWRVAWHYVYVTLLQKQSRDRHITTLRILESREIIHLFTPHLFPTLRSTTHLVSKNSPKSFPGQRIASIQRKAMPFIPGPRRAEMDENGERTYFCSWDGESCQPRLSTPRTTGVDERSKSHSTVGAQWEHLSNQTKNHPSFYGLVSYIPLFSPKA